MACAGYESAVLANRYYSSLVEPLPLFEERDPTRYIQYRSGVGSVEFPAYDVALDWVQLYQQDRYFAAFVNEILSLFTEEDEVPPQGDVVNWVFALSVLAKRLLGQKWTMPRVSTDEAGGLRLSWRIGQKEVRAVVPADLQSRYLYWQNGSEYGGKPNFGSGTLYVALHWLNENEPRTF